MLTGIERSNILAMSRKHDRVGEEGQLARSRAEHGALIYRILLDVGRDLSGAGTRLKDSLGPVRYEFAESTHAEALPERKCLRCQRTIEGRTSLAQVEKACWVLV